VKQIFLEKNFIQTRTIFSGNVLKQPMMDNKKLFLKYLHQKIVLFNVTLTILHKPHMSKYFLSINLKVKTDSNKKK
jgi:hypothetical protein